MRMVDGFTVCMRPWPSRHLALYLHLFCVLLHLASAVQISIDLQSLNGRPIYGAGTGNRMSVEVVREMRVKVVGDMLKIIRENLNKLR